MGDDLTPLAPHGRRPDAPRDARGRYSKDSAATSGTPVGRGRLYVVRRLLRDQKTELVGLVREGRMSAYEAAMAGARIGRRKLMSAR
jgi:hypothetical protein